MRRPREQSAEWHNSPEAMLRICPGYHPADGGELVARARRLRRPREQSAERHNSPEAMLRLAGLPSRRQRYTCSPAKRSASRGCLAAHQRLILIALIVLIRLLHHAIGHRAEQ
ncbi:hypothetical protein MC52_010220 [Klebsiella michiganensis]|nr:hypothetical protein C2U44_29155 [Klebsiella oxytoca]AVE79636.1 hypothetical protein AM355_21610 [Klebsiella oxytoca]PNO42921.1 hypothetical protein MC52_010220 [Klebsiella michiganensis]POT82264.1 hypothetical protein C3417_30780 [Klebsiella oxytoca]POV48246.1 hypothetical protein C3409_25315 [Klebsiella oxytoca]